MKRRLRWFGLVLALLMTVSAVAVAAPGDASLFVADIENERRIGDEGYYPSQIVLVGEDTFYARDYSLGVLRWKLGDEQPERFCQLPEYFYGGQVEGDEAVSLAENNVDVLFAWDDALWALNQRTGRLGEVTKDGVQWGEIKLDATDLTTVEGAEKYTRNRSLTHVKVLDGKLYAMRDNYAEETWKENCVLMCWDLATGAVTQHETVMAQAFCAYKPGQLVLLGTSYDEKAEKRKLSLAVLDLATDEETPLNIGMEEGEYYSVGGLVYDAPSDSLLFTYDKQIWRSVAGSPFEPVAFLTAVSSYMDNPGWLLAEGTLYALAQDGVYIRNIDPQYKATQTLRVASGWEDDTYRRFSMDNPDTPVLLSQTYYGSAEEIAELIRGGDSKNDIFMLYLREGMSSLIDKGFAADLSASAIITAEMDKLYPQIREVVTDDEGRPVAYPRVFNYDAWTLNRGLWDKFNMGPLPTTYDEFFAYMDQWNKEYAEDNPNVVFMDGSYTGTALTQLMVERYALQYQEPGKAIDFQSPVLRGVLEQIAAIDFPEPPDMEKMTETEWDEFYRLRSRPAMFYMYGRRQLFTNPEGTQFISSNPENNNIEEKLENIPPMVFEVGQQPKILAEVELMFVSPVSKNQELARKYIEYAIEHPSDLYYDYMIHPDKNDPVEDKQFPEQLKSMETWKKEVEEMLKTATEADKRDMNDTLDYINRWLSEPDKNQWLIAPAAIENYRNLAQYMQMPGEYIFGTYREGGPQEILTNLIQQYDEGKIKLDALLRELDNKLRMMLLEG